MDFMDFALSLGLTLILEGAVALIWGFRRKDLQLFVLVNVLTNPPAVLLHALFPGWVVTAALELGVIAAEAFCYSRLGSNIRIPWLFSLIANIFSFFEGLGIDRFI